METVRLRKVTEVGMCIQCSSHKCKSWYSLKIVSFSAFFYSLDVFTGFLKQYRIKQVVLSSIPGGDQIFLILYCLKKPVKEREYI